MGISLPKCKRESSIGWLHVGQIFREIWQPIVEPILCNFAASLLFLKSRITTSRLRSAWATALRDTFIWSKHSLSFCSKESIVSDIVCNSLFRFSKLSIFLGLRHLIESCSSCNSDITFSRDFLSIVVTLIALKSLLFIILGCIGSPLIEQDSRVTFLFISSNTPFHSLIIALPVVLSLFFSLSFLKVSNPSKNSTTRFLASLIPKYGIPEKISAQPCFCSINKPEKITCK